MEDVFNSPACDQLLTSLLDEAAENQEFQCLSIDGTFRVCLSIMGQAKFNEPKSSRENAAFQDKESLRRVLTVRGRSGAVLAMSAVPGESSDDIAACLNKDLPASSRAQTQHVATDNPSARLHQGLSRVLPNLQGLSLDPTHAAMHYEQALGGRRSAGSHLLRRFMAKFTAYDSSITENIWGEAFTGTNPARMTAQEQLLRGYIKDGSMSLRRAKNVISTADALTVWPTRVQFVEAVAALAREHSKDLPRKLEGTKLTIGKLLFNITASRPR